MSLTMTKVVAFHEKTNDIALFESEGIFWIGVKSKHTSHQNDDTPFLFLKGAWDHPEEGLKILERLSGEEV